MKIYNIILLLLTAVVFFGCDIKNPIDGLEVRLNSIKRESLVSAYIYDAATGTAVEQEVTATFYGVDAGKIIDETNDLKTVFKAKNGLFNFGLGDGISVSSSNPVKVIIKLESEGYLVAEYPINFTSKGIQSVTLFLAKQKDFEGTISNTGFGNTGSANSSGTTTGDVSVTAENGTTLSIPAGTTLQTSGGAPLTGSLNTFLQSIIFNNRTITMAPKNLKLNSGQMLLPIVGIDILIRDNKNNSAGTVPANVKCYLPLQQALINPLTHAPYQAGDQVPAWKLNSSGTYVSAGYATVVQHNLKPAKQFYAEGLELEISGNPDLLAGSAESCPLTVNITNPAAGYNLQVLKNGVLVKSSTTIPSSIEIERSSADASDLYEFKYGANPVTGADGVLLASYTSPSGCAGPVSLTFTYPASISGQITVNGVCTGSDPVIRVNPSATFNYREKGTSVWQQASLTDGVTYIAGLKPNTDYEGKATYRDKEGMIEIKVVTSGNFEISSEDRSAILRAEITGVSNINGSETVQMIVEIDLKNDCNSGDY